MISRIGHLAFWVSDIEKSAAFYRDILGFPEAFRMYNDDSGSLSCIYLYVTDSQFIELFTTESGRVDIPSRSVSYAHVCFEVPDAVKAMELLREKGAPIDREIKTGFSKCIQFWTHDPDGNSIEIMELPPESLQYQANRRLEKELADL